MDNYFEGWYLKHQKDSDTLAFIPGRAGNSAFIQVITSDASYNVLYDLSDYYRNKSIYVGDSVFSSEGIKINIKDEKINAYGELSYSNITPIKYDIMGIFKYLPLECYHGIISMRHDLDGTVSINGRTNDFTKGVGYIEKDKGISFPKSYLWLHCNDFREKCSIMVSIADIPFLRTRFTGCICIIFFKDKEYRLATYLGVKIDYFNDKKVILRQGKLRLEIDIINNGGQRLYAPHKGNMIRTIHESTSCKARFRFFVREIMLFDLSSNNTSFEFV